MVQGCILNAVMNGDRAEGVCFWSFTKTGVSSTFRRMYSAISTKTSVATKGIRQPHAMKVAGSMKRLTIRKVPADRESAIAPPSCGNIA